LNKSQFGTYISIQLNNNHTTHCQQIQTITVKRKQLKHDTRNHIQTITYSQFEHFQYLLLGLSFEFEINNFIGLWQAHVGISYGTALATEEDDMLEKKRIGLEKCWM
jgi:hypothetical protein